MELSELRREATALAVAESAITRCCLALGDPATNWILTLLDSKRREIEDRIEIAEGHSNGLAGKTSQR